VSVERSFPLPAVRKDLLLLVGQQLGALRVLLALLLGQRLPGLAQ